MWTTSTLVLAAPIQICRHQGTGQNVCGRVYMPLLQSSWLLLGEVDVWHELIIHWSNSRLLGVGALIFSLYKICWVLSWCLKKCFSVSKFTLLWKVGERFIGLINYSSLCHLVHLKRRNWRSFKGTGIWDWAISQLKGVLLYSLHSGILSSLVVRKHSFLDFIFSFELNAWLTCAQ